MLGNYLVLVLARVPGMHGNCSAVHMQLPDDGAPAHQLGLALLGWASHLPEAQQAHQDVLSGVLIGKEGLPALISRVVPPHELHLFWLHLQQQLRMNPEDRLFPRFYRATSAGAQVGA